MTIVDLLGTSGIHRSEAELLLAHALGKPRTWVLAHAKEEPVIDAARIFEQYVHRRNAGEPVAYIIGEKEFAGRMCDVQPGVLSPRPCTEALVEVVLDILDGKKVKDIEEIDTGIVRAVHLLKKFEEVQTVVDIGTGSGCVAISIACERPKIDIIATDISDIALETAGKNAKKHSVTKRVKFRKGAALEPIVDVATPFLIVTNPPYVTDAALLENDVFMHEPREALIGRGQDGGDILRMIVSSAQNHPFCRGIIVECLDSQASFVAQS